MTKKESRIKKGFKPQEKTVMFFEICGENYKLSDYDFALKEHKDNFKGYFKTLKDFPYTHRVLKGDKLKKIKEAPVYIVYKNTKHSLYDCIKENRDFCVQLKQITEINSLERIHEFGVVLEHFEKKDQYHAVIYETFRVLQDLSFSLNTARFALIQAHRILHFRSELIWSNGWEQLWTRSAWLNNAIVLYNSCFDKLIQSVWIAFEAFNNYQKTDKDGKPKGKPLTQKDMLSKEGMDRIYKMCVYNDIRTLLPGNIDQIIFPKYSNDFKTVRLYANRIKHRGGMRYKDLFPYGSILEIVDDNCYSSFRTQITDEIDNVVNDVKDYHNVFCNAVQEIFTCIMKEFNNHGYLKERINKVIFCKNEEKKDDEENDAPLELQSESKKREKGKSTSSELQSKSEKTVGSCN